MTDYLKKTKKLIKTYYKNKYSKKVNKSRIKSSIKSRKMLQSIKKRSKKKRGGYRYSDEEPVDILEKSFYYKHFYEKNPEYTKNFMNFTLPNWINFDVKYIRDCHTCHYKYTGDRIPTKMDVMLAQPKYRKAIRAIDKAKAYFNQPKKMCLNLNLHVELTHDILKLIYIRDSCLEELLLNDTFIKLDNEFSNKLVYIDEDKLRNVEKVVYPKCVNTTVKYPNNRHVKSHSCDTKEKTDTEKYYFCILFCEKNCSVICEDYIDWKTKEKIHSPNTIIGDLLKNFKNSFNFDERAPDYPEEFIELGEEVCRGTSKTLNTIQSDYYKNHKSLDNGKDKETFSRNLSIIDEDYQQQLIENDGFLLGEGSASVKEFYLYLFEIDGNFRFFLSFGTSSIEFSKVTINEDIINKVLKEYRGTVCEIKITFEEFKSKKPNFKDFRLNKERKRFYIEVIRGKIEDKEQLKTQLNIGSKFVLYDINLWMESEETEETKEDPKFCDTLKNIDNKSTNMSLVAYLDLVKSILLENYKTKCPNTRCFKDIFGEENPEIAWLCQWLKHNGSKLSNVFSCEISKENEVEIEYNWLLVKIKGKKKPMLKMTYDEEEEEKKEYLKYYYETELKKKKNPIAIDQWRESIEPINTVLEEKKEKNKEQRQIEINEIKKIENPSPEDKYCNEVAPEDMTPTPTSTPSGSPDNSLEADLMSKLTAEEPEPVLNTDTEWTRSMSRFDPNQEIRVDLLTGRLPPLSTMVTGNRGRGRGNRGRGNRGRGNRGRGRDNRVRGAPPSPPNDLLPQKPASNKDRIIELRRDSETGSFGFSFGIKEPQKGTSPGILTVPIITNPGLTGLQPEDIIWKVNGIDVKNKELNVVSNIIKNSPGNKVTLTIKKPKIVKCSGACSRARVTTNSSERDPYSLPTSPIVSSQLVIVPPKKGDNDGHITLAEIRTHIGEDGKKIQSAEI